MNETEFSAAFLALTDNLPFPWQWNLYDAWFRLGKFPSSCNLPTGLGKTSVIAIWLIALANHPDKTPRRLVYVVNRRTVVDQTTNEVERLRDNLLMNRPELSKFKDQFGSLALSTLRGQFADNREWSADPSQPAVICGTVDMIGSRLLFSGYGIGFKTKPLHAGFIGQDVLLVHDEAHLEQPFQDLLVQIKAEQNRCNEFGKFHVMELSATSRSDGETLSLGQADYEHPEVKKRIEAKKTIHLIKNKDKQKLADEIAGLALTFKDSGRAILIFAQKVDDVEKIVKKLPVKYTEQLTGTLRGKERDELIKTDVFRRFLPEAIPGDETVYLVCTSAGEVGINISGNSYISDLTTFESMGQRFGRVNRFGDRTDTEIHIVYPNEFDETDKYESCLKKTLDLLRQLDGDGSPKALGNLDRTARLAAFAPPATVLPVSDILFDAWALTTIRGKLPGRPPVEPYLHGVSGWEPPETHVAWREEVQFIKGELLKQYKPEDILEDYPLKPHELLRDNTSRIYDRLKKLAAPAETPVWIVSEDDSVTTMTRGELIEAGKDELNYKTVLLPPMAGGLDKGMLTANSKSANDVADELFDENGNRRRIRVWDTDKDYDAKTEGMRLVGKIDLPDKDEEGSHSWDWFELPKDGDTDGSRTYKKPVLWQIHTNDVTKNANDYLAKLQLPEELKRAIILAAKWHDLGKRRKLFQTILNNFKYPDVVLAKSGKKASGIAELYRHEFGSLIDVMDEKQPYCAELRQLSVEMQDVVLHLIAVHHGYGRPHFPTDRAFDPEPKGQSVEAIATAVVQRFARLQRRYGRWGLAYLESLLRAADYKASAEPSEFVEEEI